jgi:hypothetical protein
MKKEEILNLFKANADHEYFFTSITNQLLHPTFDLLNSMGYIVRVNEYTELVQEYFDAEPHLQSTGARASKQEESYISITVAKYSDLNEHLTYNNEIKIDIPVVIDYSDLMIWVDADAEIIEDN